MLEAGLLGVLLRDGLVGFCLLAFAFKLHFLHFFGLSLVTEISTLLVRLKLSFLTQRFFQLSC